MQWCLAGRLAAKDSREGTLEVAYGASAGAHAPEDGCGGSELPTEPVMTASWDRAWGDSDMSSRNHGNPPEQPQDETELFPSRGTRPGGCRHMSPAKEAADAILLTEEAPGPLVRLELSHLVR